MRQVRNKRAPDVPTMVDLKSSSQSTNAGSSLGGKEVLPISITINGKPLHVNPDTSMDEVKALLDSLQLLTGEKVVLGSNDADKDSSSEDSQIIENRLVSSNRQKSSSNENYCSEMLEDGGELYARNSGAEDSTVVEVDGKDIGSPNANESRSNFETSKMKPMLSDALGSKDKGNVESGTGEHMLAEDFVQRSDSVVADKEEVSISSKQKRAPSKNVIPMKHHNDVLTKETDNPRAVNGGDYFDIEVIDHKGRVFIGFFPPQAPEGMSQWANWKENVHKLSTMIDGAVNQTIAFGKTQIEALKLLMNEAKMERVCNIEVDTVRDEGVNGDASASLLQNVTSTFEKASSTAGVIVNHKNPGELVSQKLCFDAKLFDGALFDPNEQRDDVHGKFDKLIICNAGEEMRQAHCDDEIGKNIGNKWKAVLDKKNNMFYVSLNEAAQEKPTGCNDDCVGIKSHDYDGMDKHWRTAIDPDTGKQYYYNKKTREASWVNPLERMHK